MNYNKDKCIARTWNKGKLNPTTQNQCSNYCKIGQFCNMHFEKGGMSWPFGVVTEPVPSKIINNGIEHKFKIISSEERIIEKKDISDKDSDYSKLKLVELKAICEECGIPKYGKKSEVIARIKEAKKDGKKKVQKKEVKVQKKEEKVQKKEEKEKKEEKVQKKEVKEKKKSLVDLVPGNSDEEDLELVYDYDFINIQGVEYYMGQKDFKIYEADNSGKYYSFLTELGYWNKSSENVDWNTPEIEENHKNRSIVS